MFFYRGIPSGYVETWQLEKERLKRENKSEYNIIHNRLIFWNILHVLYLGLIYLTLGAYVTIFHITYSAIVVIYFEAVNYIEHYGLERKKDKNGNYESINIMHSWNAP